MVCIHKLANLIQGFQAFCSLSLYKSLGEVRTNLESSFIFRVLSFSTRIQLVMCCPLRQAMPKYSVLLKRYVPVRVSKFKRINIIFN